MEDKDDLAVVEREEPPRHKQSFDIRKAAAGLVDGAGSAMAGAVATVQKVADGAMRAATPLVDDAWQLLLMRPMVRQVLLRISVTRSTIGHTSSSLIDTGR
ncbi:hypothetical protein DXA64_06655 [Collinsella sp. OF03-4AA]|nr:hypothetical protein DXA64_06655 [Collinsella sp. OF03-4AA]